MRRAFTLVEITLALGIMATGVLAIVGLYAFGYREGQQSREDVGATALAEIVFSELTAALSDTNLTWEAFNSLEQSYPRKAWQDYITENGRAVNNPTSIAEATFNSCLEKVGKPDGKSISFPISVINDLGLSTGLVIQHEPNSGVVRLSFRAALRRQQLLAVPLFYTEAKFMGVGKKGGGG